jgi:sugar (pentulose or hexulose) kinase
MAMKTEEYYVIGIDAGTESIRVGLFELKGKMILVRNQSYRTYFPQSCWAKQNPDEWWQALCSAMNKLMNDSAVSPDRLITIRKRFC